MGTHEAGSTAGTDASTDASTALAALQLRLDRIQRLAGMGDFSIDLLSGRIRWSDEHFRIYGFEPGSFEPTARTVLDLVHPEDRDHVNEVSTSALAAGESYQVVGRIIRVDGEVRHLLSSGGVVRDDAGTPTAMIGTVIDITERVEAEHEHEVARARLEAERERRAQAIEINDRVLQGISAAGYALELGQLSHCATYLHETLDSARRMVADLMGTDEDAVPLTRTSPVDLGGLGRAADPAAG